MEQIISRVEIERSARLAAASGECRNPFPLGTAAHEEWRAVFALVMAESVTISGQAA